MAHSNRIERTKPAILRMAQAEKKQLKLFLCLAQEVYTLQALGPHLLGTTITTSQCLPNAWFSTGSASGNEST